MLSDAFREAFHHGRYMKARGLIGPGKARFLDIGCGRPCESMDDFSFAEYTGGGVFADIKRCSRPPPGCMFVVCDMMALPFKTGSFDRVSALEVVEHMPDVEAALEGVCEVLSDGGILVVSTPANNAIWRAFWPVWTRTFGRMWHSLHKSSLTEEKWVRVLSERFEVLEVHHHWLIDLVIKAMRRQRQVGHSS